MANILGQLLVELGINTAAFKEGLDKSTYQARQFSKEVSAQFSELGSSIRGLGSSFGSIAPQFSGAAGVIGNAFNLVTTSLSGAGGAIAGIGAAALGIGAAAGAAAIGLGVLAVEGANVVHEYVELQAKTGLTIRDLQTLKVAGDAAGISQDQMAVGMRKFAIALSETGKGSTAASSALRGIGVTAKEPMEALNQVAEAFKNMEDPEQRIAIATLLFGRAGQNLIPILMGGRAEFEEFSKSVDQHSQVIGTNAVNASEKYRKTLADLKASWEGLLIAVAPLVTHLIGLMSGLADAITAVVDAFKDLAAGKGPISTGNESEFLLAAQETTPADTEKSTREQERAAQKASDDAYKAKEAKALALKATQKAAFEEEQSQGQASYALMIAKRKVQDDIAAGNYADALTEQKKIPALEEQVRLEKERKTALENIPKVMGAEITKGAQEANKAYAAAVRALTDETVKSTAAAAADAAVQRLRDDAVTKNIANTTKFKDALAAATPKIQENAFFTEAFNEASKDTKGIETFVAKEKEAIAALTEHANSYGTVTRAQETETAKLIPLQTALDKQKETYRAAVAIYGENNPKVKELAELLAKDTTEYDKATDAVKRHNAALASKAVTDELHKVTDEINKLEEEIKHVGDVGGKSFMDVDEQLKKMAADTGLDVSAFESMRASLQKVHDLQVQLAKAQAAIKGASTEYTKTLGYDPRALIGIKDTAEQINKDRAAGLITENEYVAVMRQLNAQYADLQAKNGSFQAGINAGFRDYIANTQSWGETMRTVVGDGLKGIEDNFASMLTTGKTNWASLVQSMEQSLIKSALHQTLTGLFEKLGGGGGFLGSIFGGVFGGSKGGDTGAATMSGAASTFSTATDMFAQAVDSFSMAAGGEGGAGGGMFGGGMFGGLLGKLFDGGGGGSSFMGSGFGGESGFASPEGSLSGMGDWGGMFAEGGDLMPGKKYLVGEKGPEIFSPGQTGAITPNSAINSGGSTTPPTMIFHISGVSDADSFRRSQNQIFADAQAKMMAAYQRQK